VWLNLQIFTAFTRFGQHKKCRKRGCKWKRQTFRPKDLFRDLSINGGTLQLIMKKLGVKILSSLSWSRRGLNEGFLWTGQWIFGSYNGTECHDQLSNYQLLRKACTTVSFQLWTPNRPTAPVPNDTWICDGAFVKVIGREYGTHSSVVCWGTTLQAGSRGFDSPWGNWNFQFT
jgi:hypothetical protein